MWPYSQFSSDLQISHLTFISIKGMVIVVTFHENFNTFYWFWLYTNGLSRSVHPCGTPLNALNVKYTLFYLTWRHLVQCIAQKKVIGAFPGHTTAVTFTTQRPPEPTNHWPHPDRSRNAIDVLMMQAYYMLFTTRRPDAMAILTVKYGPIFISSRASMCNLKLTIEKKNTLRKD